MNKYNFDKVVNRLNNGSIKYQDGPNVLPMWVADMDFEVLPEIKESVLKSAEIDAYGYQDTSKEYFEAGELINYSWHGKKIEKDKTVQPFYDKYYKKYK